jgi:hypothetical protein
VLWRRADRRHVGERNGGGGVVEVDQVVEGDARSKRFAKVQAHLSISK